MFNIFNNKEGDFMDINELNTFVTVAQFNSFSKAAKELGYSQAAVTVHIKHLENELNVRLFDRLGKKISLTNQGKIFYGHALTVLKELHCAKNSISASDDLTGDLRIGTIDSISTSIFPKIIHTYSTRYPNVTINVTTDTPVVLLKMLQENVIDILYLLDEARIEPWLIKTLEKKEKVVFAASVHHPLMSLKSCTLNDLLAYPLLLTEEDASYRKVLDNYVNHNNICLKPSFQSNSTDLILKLVSNCDGITYLPEYVIPQDDSNTAIRILPVSDIQLYVWRQVMYHKDKWVTKEMTAFLNLCNEMV